MLELPVQGQPALLLVVLQQRGQVVDLGKGESGTHGAAFPGGIELRGIEEVVF